VRLAADRSEWFAAISFGGRVIHECEIKRWAAIRRDDRNDREVHSEIGGKTCLGHSSSF